MEDDRISPNEGYVTNRQYIPVESGKPYAIKQARKILFLDENKNPNEYIDVTNVADTLYTPLKKGFLRVSVRTSDKNLAQVEQNDTFTHTEAYYEKLIYGKDNEQNDVKLENKSILNLGDSIAAAPDGYAQQIAIKHNMALYDYAMAGATLADNNTETTTRYCVQDFLTTFKTENPTVKPDYILIEGGTNDQLHNDLGLVTDNYTDTFDTRTTIGALEDMFRQFKTDFPTSKVIFVFVHKMPTRTRSTQEEFYQEIRKALNKWSIPFVDMYNEGNLNSHFTEVQALYTDAGTHPNYLGYHTFYVPMVEGKLKNI